MREGGKKVAGAIGILLVVIVFGLRGCGLHEGTPTVKVSVKGSGGQSDLMADAKKEAKAAQGACDGQTGWIGDLVGIGGPTSVKVNPVGETGALDRYYFNCSTNKITPIP